MDMSAMCGGQQLSAGDCGRVTLAADVRYPHEDWNDTDGQSWNHDFGAPPTARRRRARAGTQPSRS